MAPQATPATPDYGRQFTVIFAGLLVRTLAIAIVGAALLLATIRAAAG